MQQAIDNPWHAASLALTAAVTAGPAVAAPVEGDFGINAAALLFVLGVWALLMGLRNLRVLRYRPMIPQRRKHDPTENSGEDTD